MKNTAGTWWEWACGCWWVWYRTGSSHTNWPWQRQISNTWPVMQLGHLVEMTAPATMDNKQHHNDRDKL